MIVLIGGSSHVGKTYLSQKLMEKRKIPYTSLDHLKMGFIRTKMTELTPNDDYEMRYFLWPFEAEMIKTAIENNQSFILEGCYIPSEWKSSFTEEYLKEIRCVFIVMSEEYLRNHIDDVISKANVIENRLCDEVNLERLINCSREFKKECLENDIPFIEITDHYDPDELVEKIEEIIDNQFAAK